MPPRTNSDKIDDLLARVERLEAQLSERSEQFTRDMNRLRNRINRIENSCNSRSERLAAVEQRCANLEKHGDRHWAFWLAILALVPGVLSLVLTLSR